MLAAARPPQRCSHASCNLQITAWVWGGGFICSPNFIHVTLSSKRRSCLSEANNAPKTGTVERYWVFIRLNYYFTRKNYDAQCFACLRWAAPILMKLTTQKKIIIMLLLISYNLSQTSKLITLTPHLYHVTHKELHPFYLLYSVCMSSNE